MKFPVISRIDAANQGRKRFYTGKPCKYGHDAQRFVTTGGCVACNAARSKLFAADKNKAQGKFVYPLHPDDHAAALAYCQALDLARGNVPTMQGSVGQVASPRGAEPPALPADIARRRAELVATYGAQPQAPYIPKP